MPGPYFPDPAAEAIRDTGFSSAAFLADENGNALEMLRFLMDNQATTRIHVGGKYWLEPATDFWLTTSNQGIEDVAVGVATQPAIIRTLNGFGWVTSASLVLGVTPAADFLSEADIGQGNAYWDLDAASDQMCSPLVFGNISHLEVFRRVFGVVPTKLSAEWWAGYEVNTNNEPGSGVGFNTVQGAFAAAAIRIYSNGTNFVLDVGGTTDVGAAKDLAIHKWKIVINKTTALVEWFMDGVSQGTVALAGSEDSWPMNWQARVVAAGGNFFQVYLPIHAWYEE